MPEPLNGRPSYRITVEDHGDRVEWTLDRNLTEVTRGAVTIGDMAVAAPLTALLHAFSDAFGAAETARRHCLSRDLAEQFREAYEDAVPGPPEDARG
jgi:hypothetical protein